QPQSLYAAQLRERLPKLQVTQDVTAALKIGVQQQGTSLILTVTNSSPQTIRGPLVVVFTRVPAGVKLANPAGFTSQHQPYYVIWVQSLWPRQSIAGVVQLQQPVLGLGGYAVRVYANTGSPAPHGLATPAGAKPSSAGTLPGLSELAPELVAALLDVS